MSKITENNFIFGFSKPNGNSYSKTQKKDDYDYSTSYIEFIEMGINRPSTNDDEIINDLVKMDAAYDANLLPNFGVGKLFNRQDNIMLQQSGRYGNFHTIDWLKDQAKDRYRHRWLRQEKLNGNIFEKFQVLHDSFSGWFCVFLVAICTGLTGGFIDITAKWMSNLKNGICVGAFWLDKEQCCWSSLNQTRDIYDRIKCEQWSTWTEFFGSSETEYYIPITAHILISLLFAFIAGFFVKFFAPYACGSGVPEIKTILSGYVMNGYLGKWTLLIKTIGMVLGTSAGLTLGKEGPMVHVACSFGNVLSRLFPKYGRNEAKKREILSASAATGVAVAFGAPIGGVLFSLEELSYYFPMKTLWRSFFCAMTGAFIIKTINPFGGKSDVLFNLEYTPEWYFFELVPFIFLGLLGGTYGFYFIKVNIFLCKIRRNTCLRKFPILEVLAVALITSSIGYFNEYTRISMSELIKRLVNKCRPQDDTLMCDYIKNITSANDDIIKLGFGPGIYHSMWQMLLAILFYLATLVITFGIKVPCGLFIPSLVIGALTGRIMGMSIELLSFYYPNVFFSFGGCKQCIVPGVYSLVGACAFLGGATRMSVSMVIIMVELTSGLSLIVPLMVSAFVAKIFGDFLNHEGIYDEHVHLNQYPLLENNVNYDYSACALDAMRPRKGDPPLVTLLKDKMRVKEIEDLINETDLNGFPIVITRASQILYGYIWTRDFKKAIEHYRYLQVIDEFTTVEFTYSEFKTKQTNSINLYKLVDTAPMCVNYQTPMEVVIDLFCKIGVSVLLVCYYGRVLGMITRKDILRHLAEEKDKKKNKSV